MSTRSGMSRQSSKRRMGKSPRMGAGDFSRPTTAGSGNSARDPVQIDYSGHVLHPSSKTLEEVLLGRKQFPSLYSDPDSAVSRYLMRPGDDFVDPQLPERRGPRAIEESGPPKTPAVATQEDDDFEALFRDESADMRRNRAKRKAPRAVVPPSSRGAAKPDPSQYAFFGGSARAGSHALGESTSSAGGGSTWLGSSPAASRPGTRGMLRSRTASSLGRADTPGAYGFGSTSFIESQEMIRLQKHCEKLTARLQQLEEMQSTALLEQTAAPPTPSQLPGGGGHAAVRFVREGARPHTTGGSRSKRGISGAQRRENLIRPMVRAAETHLGSVHGTLLHMGDLTQRLQQVYLNRGEQAEKRYKASSVIQAVVRGFITRCRHRAAKRGFGRWRRRHAKAMVQSYQIYSDKVEQIKNWTLQVQISRELRLRTQVLRGWHAYAMSQSPVKQEQAAAAAKMFLGMQNRLMIEILTRWRDTAWGKHSRKALQAKYRKRYERVKAKLEDKAIAWAEKHGGAPSRVSKEMVLHELTIDAVRVTRERMRLLDMRLPWNHWFTMLVAPMHQKTHQANEYYKHKAYTKYWGAWRTYMDKFAGVIERREPNRQRFKQRQNMLMVKHHFRIKCLTKHVKAWREYAKQSIVARRRYQNVQDALCIRVIKAWQARAHWQHNARKLVYDQWSEVSRRLYSVPFRAWFLWATEERKRKSTQRILLNAWQRRKARERLYATFKHWSHKAIYGKIEGLHSRSELVRSLEEQKRHAHALEQALNECQATLKEAEEALQNEVKARTEREEHYMQKEAKATESQFALDHAESEVIRLQTLVDNIAKIHPGTVKHLLNIDKGKQFKDPGIGAARDRAVQQSRTAEEQRKFQAATNVDFGGPVSRPGSASASSGAGTGVDADLAEDDFLTGLDPRRLPDLSLATVVFNDGDEDSSELLVADPGADRELDQVALKSKQRRRAWSVDLGVLHRVTAVTAPLPRDDAADAPIRRAPDGGHGRRRSSVVAQKGDDGILRVQDRRLSKAMEDREAAAAAAASAASSLALHHVTVGGQEARRKTAASKSMDIGGIAWVQVEDAMIVRRLKQVVRHINDTNAAKNRLAVALQQLSERREKFREERRRKQRLRNILNRQDKKVKTSKKRRQKKGKSDEMVGKALAGGGGALGADVADNLDGISSGESEHSDDEDVGDERSDAADSASDSASDGDSLSVSDSEEERLEDEEAFVDEAAKMARQTSATAGEEEAVESLIDIYKANKDAPDPARTRAVELKRWVATWAYIMDGKRLWVGPRGEEEEDIVDDTALLRDARIARYVGDTEAEYKLLAKSSYGLKAPGGPVDRAEEDAKERLRRAKALKDRAEAGVVLRDVGDAEASTWGAFVQGVSFEFPTHHESFVTTQEKLDVQQTMRRKELVEKKKRLRAGVSLYKAGSFYGT